MLDGAKRCGLKLDTEHGTRIHGFAPDSSAPLVNTKGGKPGVMDLIKTDRKGPSHAWQVHVSAQRRWAASRSKANGGIYRPQTLAAAATELDVLNFDEFEPPVGIVAIETVRQGDNLGKISRRVYGAVSHYMVIFEANRDTLDNPDTLFPGQKLRIPRLLGITAADPNLPIDIPPKVV